MDNTNLAAPMIEGTLRSHNVKLPAEAQLASGIRVLGRPIRSLVFTTDIALIRNCDADAVFAVYPFTPQPIITKSLVESSSIPVFVGVGGRITNGSRSAILAHDAEADGAYGVVLNSSASNATVEIVSRVVDIPVVVTVLNDDPSVVATRIDSGASIINVAGGKDTPRLVESLRTQFPTLPIIATGGVSGENILTTIDAGANAVICTPPSTSQLLTALMDQYRTTFEEAERARRPLSEELKQELFGRLEDLRKSGIIID